MVEQVTRRERYRQQTIDEIKTLAMEQVTDGGVATVSLNAIARTMAMSPGALTATSTTATNYSHELAVAAYDSLADALERAVPADGSRSARLTAVAEAYREWAVQQPNTDRLVFESPTGSARSSRPSRSRRRPSAAWTCSCAC